MFLKLDEAAVFWFVGMFFCLLSFWDLGEEQSVCICICFEEKCICVSVSPVCHCRLESEKSKMICASVMLVLEVSNRWVVSAIEMMETVVEWKV